MLRIRQIKIPVENSNDEVLLSKIAKILHIKTSDITSFSIKKKSLDARKKDAIYYIYEVDVKTPKEALILKSNTSNDIFASPNEEYICPPAAQESCLRRNKLYEYAGRCQKTYFLPVAIPPAVVKVSFFPAFA